MSLINLLNYQFQNNKEKIAIIHNASRATYAKLDNLSSKYAHILKEIGINEEDKVGICLSRSIDSIALLIACIKIGAIYVPLDPKNYELHSLNLISSYYKPKIIIYENFDDINGLENCYNIDIFKNSNSDRLFLEKLTISDNKPFCILYTSGSTNAPKGVARTHLAVTEQILFFIKSHDENLVLGQVFSFRHVASIVQIFGTLCIGGTIVIIDDNVKKIPHKLIEISNQFSITRLGFSPQRYEVFLNEIKEKKLSLNSVNEISCTGDNLKKTTIEKSLDLLPKVTLINSYGSTETGGIARQVCTKDFTDEMTIYPSVDVKIIDENNSLLPLEQAGEILVSSKSVGYYYESNDSNCFITIDGKLYFRTGDLGYLKENNTLVILGRNKFTIKINGRKIFFNEINAKLQASYNIIDSLVSEISLDKNTNILTFFYIAKEELEIKKFQKISQEILPIESRPKAYIKINEIPLIDNGKVNYQLLREKYKPEIVTQYHSFLEQIKI